jgi:hypothetical protein
VSKDDIDDELVLMALRKSVVELEQPAFAPRLLVFAPRFDAGLLFVFVVDLSGLSFSQNNCPLKNT